METVEDMQKRGLNRVKYREADKGQDEWTKDGEAGVDNKLPNKRLRRDVAVAAGDGVYVSESVSVRLCLCV